MCPRAWGCSRSKERRPLRTPVATPERGTPEERRLMVCLIECLLLCRKWTEGRRREVRAGEGKVYGGGLARP